MNTVNDQVQKLFSKYEDKVRSGQKSFSDFEDNDNERRLAEILTEIRTLRYAWDALGWDWHDHDFEREHKRSLYLKRWGQVRNKLAMKPETIVDADYWWTPPQHTETETLLLEIAVTLRRAFRRPLWRDLSLSDAATMIWHVAKQLLYLGIIAALLLSSQSHLETRVIALLVLIYNHVTLAAGSLGLALDGIQVQVSNELKRVARSMKLRAPVWDLKTEEEFRMGAWLNSLSGLSAYLGSLIAVVALVWSLF